MRRPGFIILLGLGAVVGALGCSDKGDNPSRTADAGVGGTGVVIGFTGGNEGIGATGNAGAPADAGVSFVKDPTTGNCDIVMGQMCTGAQYESETIPLDIHILFDQTGSMCNCVDPVIEGGPCPDPTCRKTRLDAVREAMGQFLNDPQSLGIQASISYFGYQPLGQVNCDPATYVAPAVGMGALPGNASAIMSSLNAVTPIGETPTGAAIRGACTYAKEWKTQHPGEQTVILMLTDGKPEAPASCSPASTNPCCSTINLADAVDAATTCRNGSPGIQTYVLGVGPLLGNLNDIAAGGGTDQAYLVESGDVSAQVLAALNAIRGKALPCEYQLPKPPPDQVLAFNKVNVAYANALCEGNIYYYVETADQCGANGAWYYDNPTAPTKVSLCPAACQQVAAPGAGGQILFSVGCNTLAIPQ
jgi:hypothetical protein